MVVGAGGHVRRRSAVRPGLVRPAGDGRRRRRPGPAAGGLEAVFTVKAIADQVAPPTINIFNQDPACDLDFVPGTAREMDINVALSNSFGFGGTNGTLIFRKPD